MFGEGLHIWSLPQMRRVRIPAFAPQLFEGYGRCARTGRGAASNAPNARGCFASKAAPSPQGPAVCDVGDDVRRPEDAGEALEPSVAMRGGLKRMRNGRCPCGADGAAMRNIA